MFLKRRHLGLLLAAIFAVVLVFFLLDRTVWWQHYWHAAGPAQRELLALYEALEPGSPEAQVQQAWRDLHLQYLTILCSEKAHSYFVNTPKSFFYKDWVLIVRIEKGRIRDVVIRMRDGHTDEMHPKTAPPDKLLGKSERPLVM